MIPVINRAAAPVINRHRAVAPVINRHCRSMDGRMAADSRRYAAAGFQNETCAAGAAELLNKVEVEL